MYLKSIEVQGFKSFAHKMKFEFHNGITGIVGPNGSGKSNVADAVRWVLGEQSAKQLRGGNMQDVIFAGTEIRRPQSFASVSITLDNSDHTLDIDYDEVTVQRRLYRSGESEYLLNGTNVRLRDVYELFYDTGIGKEGYSIIGQGRIDRIISGRSEERRELFDEAAGIVKFKRRKATAIKKLENEEQNLLRVTDILREISGRIEPLKNQAEKAREYLGYKTRLRALDVNLFLIDTGKVQGELDTIDENYRIAEDGIREKREAFERTKTEYEAIEENLEKIDAQVSALRKKEEENSLTAEQLRGHAEVVREQIRSILQEDERARTRGEVLAGEIRERETSLSEKKAEAASYAAQLEQTGAGLSEKAEALSEAEEALLRSQKASDEAKSGIIGLLGERAALQGAVERYDAMREQISIRSAGTARREIELAERKTRVAEDVAAAASARDEAVREVESLRGGIDRENGLAMESRRRLADANVALEKETETYHRAASRLESLRSIAERYEGYGGAIKEVMSLRESEKGICGVVADILKVDKEYETAIETALEGSIRSIVTDTQDEAKKLITHLRTEKAGRATFLPLDALKSRGKADRAVLEEKGIIDTADRLVSVEKRYAVLPEYLLGRIFVAETMEDAVRVSRKFDRGIAVVTLTGEYIKPGGSMTGGAFRGRENLLGRKREIGELTKETAEHRAEIDRLREEIAEARKTRDRHLSEAQRFQELLHEAEIRENTAELTLQQAEEEQARIADERKALDEEKAALSVQIKEVEEGRSGATGELAGSERLEQELNGRVETLSREAASLEEKRNAAAAALEEIRLAETELRQKKAFAEDTVDRLTAEIAARYAEAESLAAGTEGNAAALAERETEIRETEEEIARILKETEAGRQETLRLTEEKAAMKEEHRGFFEKRDALSEEITQLDREIFRLSAQRDKLLESISAQTEYLWDEYELTPALAALEKREDLTDRAAIRKETGALRAQIRRLGDVNVGAIEEYKETSERYEFLSAQHDDLVRSGEALRKIIAELDTGMRKQFAEQFAKINLEFDRVFKELFGGGTGTISLEEEADVLEANIAISAQPPGKKLQNMLQLSGGEKSLTAIALLFAIQNLKPSPFALLDEIEASLDEANVTRFTRYLRKLSANTQFIVITHRRGTMAAADRLYGITMQEKGVSALVSVNLVEGELDA